jgi:hypothetical protein
MSDLEMWTEHAAFMDALAYDGFVVLGGPVGNGAKDPADHRRRE